MTVLKHKTHKQTEATQGSLRHAESTGFLTSLMQPVISAHLAYLVSKESVSPGELLLFLGTLGMLIIS